MEMLLELAGLVAESSSIQTLQKNIASAIDKAALAMSNFTVVSRHEI